MKFIKKNLNGPLNTLEGVHVYCLHNSYNLQMMGSTLFPVSLRESSRGMMYSNGKQGDIYPLGFSASLRHKIVTSCQ